MDITCQEAEACMQELPARSLHHLPSDLQSGPHLTVNDLHRMFVGNLNPFSLQSRQNKPLSPHSFGKCSLECSSRSSDPHTNPHYVIPQCGGLTCFRNGQIRGLQTYTCSRKPSAPILGPGPLLDFSILNGPSITSNLQAPPRAFRHSFA